MDDSLLTLVQTPILSIYTYISHAFGPASDQYESKELKHESLCQRMGFDKQASCYVKQIHKAEVAIVDLATKSSTIQADAMVSITPGRLLCIQTADCTPILLCDPVIPVVAAVHSGWRGTYAGVIQNTIKAMVQLGASLERIIAVIGPTIRQSNYEVGDEVRECFAEKMPESGQFFMAGRDNHYFFDLPGCCHYILRQSGLQQVYDTNIDTYTNPHVYYSYRRFTHAKKAMPPFGQQVSAIGIRVS